MKIKKININNFGIITRKNINLENGINIIYCKNKQIKTIIQNFIVCFLYGMDNDRKLFRNVFRRRYAPFALEKTKGELVVEKNNVEYAIERSFGTTKSQDSSKVVRLFDQEPIFNINFDQPGKSFLDIGFEAFHRTMFVKNIDDFVLFNNNSRLDNDILKIKENFDNKFSFDRAVELISCAKKIIKDIKVSGNINELYEKYYILNSKLEKEHEKINLNYLNRSKLDNLNKRREYLINEYSLIELSKKHFKYLDLKKVVEEVIFVEDEILKLEQDLKNINKDMPRVSENDVDEKFISSFKEKVEIYKESRREILKINKVDISEESKAFERFEQLNKELEKYSIVKSNFLFYSEKIRKIDTLTNELDNLKGHGKISHLFKNTSRSKKNKQKRNYTKFYIFVVILAILITVVAPVFKLSSNGIILISITSFVLLGLAYAYIAFNDYKEIESKGSKLGAGKYYDLHSQISKLEKELYPYTYYKIKKDVERIKKIEDELDTLSFRFKEGDLSYISVIKDFREQEKSLKDVIAECGFDDIFIQDIENFIENIEFKLKYKSNIIEELQNKNQKLLEILDGRNRNDLINEMESLEKYSNIKVEKTFDQIEDEYNILKIELKNIDDEISFLKDELKNSIDHKKQIEIINDEILNLRNTISYLESKITNIDVYIEKITDIYYDFKGTLSPEISTRIEYIINYLTRDSRGFSKMSYRNEYDKGGVLVKEKLGLEFLNAGMWDLLYFALRITIADLIYEDKGEVPLILDDLFVSYDYEKMKKALMLLEKYSKDRQVILFTSTTREIEYLKGNAYIVNM